MFVLVAGIGREESWWVREIRREVELEVAGLVVRENADFSMKGYTVYSSFALTCGQSVMTKLKNPSR